MSTLLIHAPANQDTGQGTLFGGRPIIPSASASAFIWPVCRSCRKPMQFLGRLMIPEDQTIPRHLILLFQCHNEPGMCDDWESDKGGNCALIVPEGPVDYAQPPAHPDILRPTLYTATTVVVPGSTAEPHSYVDAMQAWTSVTGRPKREILGQILGSPEWIQADQSPSCSTCGAPMKFVAQLEEGPDHQSSMNFAGGAAYIFECPCGTAKFLWQC